MLSLKPGHVKIANISSLLLYQNFELLFLVSLGWEGVLQERTRWEWYSQDQRASHPAGISWYGMEVILNYVLCFCIMSESVSSPYRSKVTIVNRVWCFIIKHLWKPLEREAKCQEIKFSLFYDLWIMQGNWFNLLLVFSIPIPYCIFGSLAFGRTVFWSLAIDSPVNLKITQNPKFYGWSKYHDRENIIIWLTKIVVASQFKQGQTP